MADFPATLPAPNVSGYRLQPVEPTVRTDMEVGAPRVRRRTRARNDQISLEWLFTSAEMATFRTWFDDDATGAAGGAGWFNVSLDAGDGAMQTYEARFTRVWDAAARENGRYLVTGTVEIR